MSGRYRATRVRADGYLFDSKLEHDRYQGLKLLERVGAIHDLRLHPRFPIRINGFLVCHVELDFSYRKPDGTLVHEDTKGHDNPMSRLKRKLVEAEYDIKVRIVRSVRRRAAA